MSFEEEAGQERLKAMRREAGRKGGQAKRRKRGFDTRENRTMRTLQIGNRSVRIGSTSPGLQNLTSEEIDLYLYDLAAESDEERQWVAENKRKTATNLLDTIRQLRQQVRAGGQARNQKQELEEKEKAIARLYRDNYPARTMIFAIVSDDPASGKSTRYSVAVRNPYADTTDQESADISLLPPTLNESDVQTIPDGGISLPIIRKRGFASIHEERKTRAPYMERPDLR